jgi:hypothetical protein
MSGEVWLVVIDAEGPEAGDYDGWWFAHASREGGLRRLAEKLKEQYDIDEVIPDATADNGSMAGTDKTDDGWTVEWMLQWTSVEP